MKELVQIELNQKDIKALVAEKFNLHEATSTISVSHWQGDSREPEYTSIVVKGRKVG